MKKIATIVVIVMLAVCFAGCSEGGKGSTAESFGKGESIVTIDAYDVSGGVAAEVGDKEIGENAVTAYINNFRYAQKLQDDGDWGQWIYDNGYTMDGLRIETVNYLVDLELIRQAAAANDVEVTDEELDQAIQDVRDSMTEEEFANELDQRGLNEENYRDEIYITLLQGKLQEKVAPAQNVSDEFLLEQLKKYYPNDVAEDATTLDGIEQVKIDNVKQMLESNAKQIAFSSWMDDFKAGLHVQTNSMPDGLPYAVDLTPYAETDNTTQSASGSDASGSASTGN